MTATFAWDNGFVVIADNGVHLQGFLDCKSHRVNIHGISIAINDQHEEFIIDNHSPFGYRDALELERASDGEWLVRRHRRLCKDVEFDARFQGDLFLRNYRAYVSTVVNMYFLELGSSYRLLELRAPTKQEKVAAFKAATKEMQQEEAQQPLTGIGLMYCKGWVLIKGEAFVLKKNETLLKNGLEIVSADDHITFRLEGASFTGDMIHWDNFAWVWVENGRSTVRMLISCGQIPKIIK